MQRIYFLATLIFLLAGTCQASEPAPKRPNIIFILIDDMGFSDLSSFGNLEMETPNIDRIANQGIKFSNFYASSPICSPSRVGFFTGQFPSRHRIFSHLDSRASNKRRGMADYLEAGSPNIARMLKNAGYATGHFGKWHMGGGRDVDDAPLPQAYGFDESLTSFEGLGDRVLEKKQNLSVQSAKLGKGTITWAEKWEYTGILVDRAISFAEKNQDNPFYLQLWTGDVHDPYLPNPLWTSKFKQFDNDPYKRDFYATLNNLDEQIGRFLDALDKLGLSKNTLVVLASDNGPTDWPYYYEQGFWPPGDAGPFRGRKWSLFEGGIRTPFMARWPGKIPKGVSNDTTILSAVDLLPTLAKLANVSLPEANLDGEDLSGAFVRKDQQRTKPLFWDYGRNQFYLKPGNKRFVSPTLAVRDGNWKLLMNKDGSQAELYNLKDDRAETTNLATRNPEITGRLSTMLLNWYKTLPDML